MFAAVASGVGAAAFVLPVLGLVDDPATAGTALPALAITIAVAALVWWRRDRPPARIAGGLVVAGCSWLFSQARAGAINWLLAALLGLGIALALPLAQLRNRLTVVVAAATAAVLVVLAATWGPTTAWTWGALTGLALAVPTAVDRRRRAGWLVPTTALLGVVLVGSWIGANSPTADWFGSTVSHGPRDRPEVAVTFDDGPDVSATLAIARAFDDDGAKATFFSVGKAVVARPDITRALIADGHLVGNHSYHHDEWRWLDPRYPELMRAQRAIHTQVGVCPAFYRPPHGQHTPFMAWAMSRHGVTMVGWDVSAGDWATSDPQVIADRVLSKVRAGSIVDLHDGLDGDVNADRTVLVRAVPLILDGLRAHGLRPVRLDQLLGRPGYTTHC